MGERLGSANVGPKPDICILDHIVNRRFLIHRAKIDSASSEIHYDVEV